ncbi:MAG TPA: PepSY domain-containing protein [Edaphobacter sp.]|nr:PepSY domain-containing protein [Edaphobacter sp.]
MIKNATIKSIRLLHRYFGLFFAPAILFFAFSGAIQTFGWHESSRSSGYEPPTWIARMAQLHKKQTLVIPPAKKKAPGGTLAERTHIDTAQGKKPAGDSMTKFLLKCFVFLMSIGSILSTLLGVVMALLYGGDSRIVWTVVVAGILLPVAILLL